MIYVEGTRENKSDQPFNEYWYTLLPTFYNVTGCDCPRFVPTFEEIKFMDLWHHVSPQPILTHISLHFVHATTVQKGAVTLIACKVF